MARFPYRSVKSGVNLCCGIATARFVSGIIPQARPHEQCMNGAATPPGTRLYAIGDIHGRADLLRLLLAQIAEDAAGRPPAAQQLIYLGDYVDRGPDSLGVIDIVMDEVP